MRRLAILGASGHGKVVADAAILGGWNSPTFFDDGWPSVSQVGTWRVVGTSAHLWQRLSDFDGFVVAIGANSVRLLKQRALADGGLAPVTLVHPGAVVSASAELGAGSVVLAGAVVNADARLGIACIVNTCASIDHDCQLGAGVHVSPGAHLGGTVTVGEATWIGIGASVRNGVRIGARAMVGGGAMVVRDVADGITVAGVPARPMSSKGPAH